MRAVAKGGSCVCDLAGGHGVGLALEGAGKVGDGPFGGEGEFVEGGGDAVRGQRGGQLLEAGDVGDVRHSEQFLDDAVVSQVGGGGQYGWHLPPGCQQGPGPGIHVVQPLAAASVRTQGPGGGGRTRARGVSPPVPDGADGQSTRAGAHAGGPDSPAGVPRRSRLWNTVARPPVRGPARTFPRVPTAPAPGHARRPHTGSAQRAAVAQLDATTVHTQLRFPSQQRAGPRRRPQWPRPARAPLDCVPGAHERKLRASVSTTGFRAPLCCPGACPGSGAR